MKFGLQFFPDVAPQEKSGQQYWNECLDLVSLCDELGYGQVRTVEHYFEPYGGYSPAPHIILTAASQRTKNARLLTGAVLPIFNDPLKVAGEIGMLDAISNGRLDCGFGRAFLPHEFHRLGRTMDESRARFDEGVEAVRLLLEEEEVTFRGQFHQFENITSLPRPTQKPRPPIWIAAFGTPESVKSAAVNGFNLMLVPFAGPVLRPVMELYRTSWNEAGHPGRGEISLAFHMFCHKDRDEAIRIARPNVNRYLESMMRAVRMDSGWGFGTQSSNYPRYQEHMDKLGAENFDSMLESGAVWVGTPGEITRQISSYLELAGQVEWASLQVNFNRMTYGDAEQSMRLFAREVMPNFQSSTTA